MVLPFLKGISNCFNRVLTLRRRSSSDNAILGLCELPRKIEEIFIAQYFMEAINLVLIEDLPDTLRLLDTVRHKLQKVYVAFEALPKALERVNVLSEKDTIQRL